MCTLIELYSEAQIQNVLPADTINPERVIFVGDIPKRQRERLVAYFTAKGKSTPKFAECDMSDAEAVYRVLESMVSSHEECSIDITGGSGEAVFAAGRAAQKHGAAVVKYDADADCMRTIYGGSGLTAAAEYKIGDIIALAGGSVRGSGHFDLAAAYENISDKIDTMWRIYMDYRTLWYKQVRYFQQALRSRTSASSPGNGECSEEIMKRLKKDGILSKLKIGKKIEFAFADANIARLICDVGVWLELYVYKNLLGCSEFDDVLPGVVIDWNGVPEVYDVLNEVDVIAKKGMKTLFISCKTGPVSVEAVNEINVLCSKFGGLASNAVIVTATNMSEENLCTYKRACELGIRIIELDDLIKGRLAARLSEM